MGLLGSTVWGIGEAPFTEADLLEHSTYQLLHFPSVTGVVVVVHSRNVTGSLWHASASHMMNFTSETVAGIFSGAIEYWDDSRIVSDNPMVNLLHQPITVVVRSNSSGQTTIFTDYLQNNVPDWPSDAVGTSQIGRWVT